MNSILKWVIFVICLLVILYAFSSSYNSQNIDKLDYVVALGIDTDEESSNYKVSFEFANIYSFSQNSSSSDSEPIINSVVAPSIPIAINIMDAYLGKRLNLSHCKVVIFSEDNN